MVDVSVKTLRSLFSGDGGVWDSVEVGARPTAWLGVQLLVVSVERGQGDVWSSFSPRYLYCVTVYSGGDGGAEDVCRSCG